MKKVLIFNPNLSAAKRMLEHYGLECHYCCLGAECGGFFERLLQRLIDENGTEVVLVNERFWKKQYGEDIAKRITDFINNESKLELWVADDCSDFAMMKFESSGKKNTAKIVCDFN